MIYDHDMGYKLRETYRGKAAARKMRLGRSLQADVFGHVQCEKRESQTSEFGQGNRSLASAWRRPQGWPTAESNHLGPGL